MTVRVKRCEVLNPDTLKFEVSEGRMDIVMDTGYYEACFIADSEEVDFSVFPAEGHKLLVSVYTPTDAQAVHCHDVVTVSGEAPYLLSALSGKDERVSCVFRLKPGAAVKVTEV